MDGVFGMGDCLVRIHTALVMKHLSALLAWFLLLFLSICDRFYRPVGIYSGIQKTDLLFILCIVHWAVISFFML
ncbi:hypothetical protein BO78DRAFT_87538 [Aspergillus sclerotiicarbonarius CBS 121057]|uniref:Uncharacterized protein n=1 Tax=Aspergillus sclerotiicarbonarius (strain CBS 121057 / IBT 28362) TaxID=1448318 RepID=A0A319EJ04_ASPSB|nr:hypothetical protein BO78DRAFT_87538 [Aspergillus sclerotiicarbonarius CBS 121057]